MNNPGMTVKVTGEKDIHDEYNGIHHFVITAEKDNVAVRSEFGLDMSGRRIEAKFWTPEGMLILLSVFTLT